MLFVKVGGDIIWYALYCENQMQKKQLLIDLENLEDRRMGNVIDLTYDRMRRYEGRWHCERTELLPDYVVVDSVDKIGLEKILNGSGKKLHAVNGKFEEFFRELCSTDGNLPMSRGAIHQGITQITEGPLTGKEKYICKIDRHKRLAALRITPLESVTMIRVGLEITEKN